MAEKSSMFRYIKDADAVLLLAFVGGLYDTAGYILLQGVFTSSITGNLVAAVSTVRTNVADGVVCRSMIIVTFVLGSGLNTFISMRLKYVDELNNRMRCFVLFMMELLFMIVVWILGLCLKKALENASNEDNGDDPNTILLASIMGAAMGLHNIAAKEAIANCPSTTVMTMTLVSVASTFFTSLTYFLASKKLLLMKPNRLSPNRLLKAFLTNSSKNERNDTPIGINVENLYANTPDISMKPETSSKNQDIQRFTKSYIDAEKKFIVTVKPLIAFIFGGLIGAVVASYGDWWFSPITIAAIFFLMICIAMREMEDRAQNKAKSQALESSSDSDRSLKSLKSLKSNDKNTQGTATKVLDEL